MSDNTVIYQEFIDDLAAHLATLSKEECAQLAAVLSTAETQVLAAMADNYPTEDVKK